MPWATAPPGSRNGIPIAAPCRQPWGLSATNGSPALSTSAPPRSSNPTATARNSIRSSAAGTAEPMQERRKSVLRDAPQQARTEARSLQGLVRPKADRLDLDRRPSRHLQSCPLQLLQRRGRAADL